ncbi:hypothetical protein RRG08_016193 [Elysia crispata]|uniref:Uncharacterized protein n=1 Tax=Elysia crispata TaxID=231223 RepID=A0AAE0ZPF3_9GAST|nr:hypothetical protein RRG08_016193 [Elysia crispata]
MRNESRAAETTRIVIPTRNGIRSAPPGSCDGCGSCDTAGGVGFYPHKHLSPPGLGWVGEVRAESYHGSLEHRALCEHARILGSLAPAPKQLYCFRPNLPRYLGAGAKLVSTGSNVGQVKLLVSPRTTESHQPPIRESDIKFAGASSMLTLFLILSGASVLSINRTSEN